MAGRRKRGGIMVVVDFGEGSRGGALTPTLTIIITQVLTLRRTLTLTLTITLILNPKP